MTFKEAFLFYVEYIARATQGKRRLPKTGRAFVSFGAAVSMPPCPHVYHGISAVVMVVL